MSDNLVITIGREFGSGGHAIAKAVAKDLGFKLYDKEILDLAAKNSGLNKEMLKDYDEKPTNSFLYSLSLGAYSFENAIHGAPQIPVVDKVFSIQSEVIKQVADEGNCVIVGRCADSVLRGHSNMLTVFIHADLEQRARRVMEYENIDFSAACALVKKSDKKRAGYHNYFSDYKWGSAQSYDLCIDSKLGYDKAAELIEYCAKNRIFNK